MPIWNLCKMCSSCLYKNENQDIKAQSKSSPKCKQIKKNYILQTYQIYVDQLENTTDDTNNVLKKNVKDDNSTYMVHMIYLNHQLQLIRVESSNNPIIKHDLNAVPYDAHDAGDCITHHAT